MFEILIGFLGGIAFCLMLALWLWSVMKMDEWDRED